MSDMEELWLLIEEEKQKGSKLDKEMSRERKLLEEAEYWKKRLMIEILQEELRELRKRNEDKGKELMEIKKWKISTLEEVANLESRFAESVSFSFLYDISSYVLVYFVIDKWFVYYRHLV